MISGQMISPALFGLTYAATVGTFPQGIFLAATAIMVCSLLLVSFVRLPKSQPAKVEEGRVSNHLCDETLHDPTLPPVPKLVATGNTLVEA